MKKGAHLLILLLLQATCSATTATDATLWKETSPASQTNRSKSEVRNKKATIKRHVVESIAAFIAAVVFYHLWNAFGETSTTTSEPSKTNGNIPKSTKTSQDPQKPFTSTEKDLTAIIPDHTNQELNFERRWEELKDRQEEQEYAKSFYFTMTGANIPDNELAVLLRVFNEYNKKTTGLRRWVQLTPFYLYTAAVIATDATDTSLQSALSWSFERRISQAPPEVVNNKTVITTVRSLFQSLAKKPYLKDHELRKIETIRFKIDKDDQYRLTWDDFRELLSLKKYVEKTSEPINQIRECREKELIKKLVSDERTAHRETKKLILMLLEYLKDSSPSDKESFFWEIMPLYSQEKNLDYIGSIIQEILEYHAVTNYQDRFKAISAKLADFRPSFEKFEQEKNEILALLKACFPLGLSPNNVHIKECGYENNTFSSKPPVTTAVFLSEPQESPKTALTEKLAGYEKNPFKRSIYEWYMLSALTLWSTAWDAIAEASLGKRCRYYQHHYGNAFEHYGTTDNDCKPNFGSLNAIFDTLLPNWETSLPKYWKQCGQRFVYS